MNVSTRPLCPTRGCPLDPDHDGDCPVAPQEPRSLNETVSDHLLRMQQDHDPVNHPSHYCSHPSGVECITISRHHNFNIGNVFKYLWRAGLKDSQPTVQDLQKAAWYLNDEIERVKAEAAQSNHY